MIETGKSQLLNQDKGFCGRNCKYSSLTISLKSDKYQ